MIKIYVKLEFIQEDKNQDRYTQNTIYHSPGDPSFGHKTQKQESNKPDPLRTH